MFLRKKFVFSSFLWGVKYPIYFFLLPNPAAKPPAQIYDGTRKLRPHVSVSALFDTLSFSFLFLSYFIYIFFKNEIWASLIWTDIFYFSLINGKGKVSLKPKVKKFAIQSLKLKMWAINTILYVRSGNFFGFDQVLD